MGGFSVAVKNAKLLRSTDSLAAMINYCRSVFSVSTASIRFGSVQFFLSFHFKFDGYQFAHIHHYYSYTCWTYTLKAHFSRPRRGKRGTEQTNKSPSENAMYVPKEIGPYRNGRYQISQHIATTRERKKKTAKNKKKKLEKIVTSGKIRWMMTGLWKCTIPYEIDQRKNTKSRRKESTTKHTHKHTK